MAKKRSTKQPPNTLAQFIDEISRIDREIIRLSNQRADLTKDFDAQANDDRAKHDRAQVDRDAVKKALSGNKGPLADSVLERMLGELASSCRQLTQKVRVSYLGPAFSYSHLAAKRFFGNEEELTDVNSIATVFEDVEQHHADFGVVPLENSTDGRVSDTLDMFARTSVKICGEIKLNINHCLLAKCDRGEIKTVGSKPQAMSQCRSWLAKHLPSAKLVEMPSTAAAAELAAKKDGAAAIASKEAGLQYGLQVVDEGIQDKKGNSTRFAVIGHDIGKRTRKDKTSFLFVLPHQPGALADILNIFKRNKLNMTWIESFPHPESNEEYLFFVETMGHAQDLKVKQAISALKKKADRLELLGSYARANPTD